MLKVVSRGEEGPEFLGAACGHPIAELRRPVALIAEVVPPGEQPERKAVQDMLPGEAYGAMNLVRDRSAFRCGLGGADFRRGNLEENRIIEGASMRDCCRR